MSRRDAWTNAQRDNGWVMPAAPLWKRLPIIRHARAVLAAWRVRRWYRHGPGAVGIPTGYDAWVLHGMWIGAERTGKSGGTSP